MRIESWVGVTAVLSLLFGGAIAADEQQWCRFPLARERRHAPARSRARDPAHLRPVAGLQGAVPAHREARTTCASLYGLIPSIPSRCRAFTIMQRHGHDIRADVHLPPSSDSRELLAHEFEHLLEQIEGLDLQSLARVKGSGVHEIEDRRVRDRSRAGGGTRRAGRRRPERCSSGGLTADL